MIVQNSTFGYLFKKFRLKSGFTTLAEFGDVLAQEGLVYENSLFSHWQNGDRVPKDRTLLLSIVKIFIEREGINSIKEVNIFLESSSHGHLTGPEIQYITKRINMSSRLSSPKKIVEFLSTTGKSKRILRSGWIREKVKNPESVAEHSFQLSVLAMILSDQLGVDKEKLIKMAILHDLGEVITGDIVWSRGEIMDIKKRIEKENQEKEEIAALFKIIGKESGYRKIFEEMIERTSQEAKILWELDKLEMALQALAYEKEQNKNLDEFFINADLQIHSKTLRRIFKEILKQRPGLKS